MRENGENGENAERTRRKNGGVTFLLGGVLGAGAGLVVGLPVAALLGGFETGMWVYMVPHFVLAFMGTGLWTVPLMFPGDAHLPVEEVSE